MIGYFKRRWFESRTLAVLQVHYEQPVRKPRPQFEAQLLRGAVNLTMQDGGTPFDAATRFYAAYAETALGRGIDLDSINFFGVLGRMFALRHEMKFYREHHDALKALGTAAQQRGEPASPGT